MAGDKRKAVTIGTHSGTFHCDEALGCWLLRQTQAYRDASIVRSRDKAVLDAADVVIDVGATYEPEAARFDHHQRGFGEVFGHGFNTKLSSAGLVYKHFGREIIADHMTLPADHADVNTVYLQVYRNFIEAVDAIDNGIEQWESSGPPRYINTTGLSARVAKLNPTWRDPYTDEELDARFAKAMALAGAEFSEALRYVSSVWLPAKQVVAAAVGRRGEVDPSGQIIAFTEGGVPWKEHLFDIEAELGISGSILYVLYEDEREHKWRIQAVPPGAGSFEQRKGLPAEWRGLRDEALDGVAGIARCTFVHAAGFIGGNATYDGVLAMARKALAA